MPVADLEALIQHPRFRRYELFKRIIDLVFASTILVLLSPFWFVITIAIKLTSPGPVLYRRRVVGRNGREFFYYKFRTMVVNNDDDNHRAFLERLVRADQPHTVIAGCPIYKLVPDPRVTPLGRVLRRLSLDEIPQLINVLRGEMSIVGPRPPIPHEFAFYSEYDKQRLIVMPGITGLYQVTARSVVGFRQMVELDLIYIRRCSPFLDMWIMLRTFLVMIRGSGAA